MGSYVDPLTAQATGVRICEFGNRKRFGLYLYHTSFVQILLRDISTLNDPDAYDSDAEADDYKSAFLNEEGEIYEGG